MKFTIKSADSAEKLDDEIEALLKFVDKSRIEDIRITASSSQWLALIIYKE